MSHLLVNTVQLSIPYTECVTGHSFSVCFSETACSLDVPKIILGDLEFVCKA